MASVNKTNMVPALTIYIIVLRKTQISKETVNKVITSCSKHYEKIKQGLRQKIKTRGWEPTLNHVCQREPVWDIAV